jgi:hypothetical protein
MTALISHQTSNTGTVKKADIRPLVPKKEKTPKKVASLKGEENTFAKIASGVFYFLTGFVIYAGWKLREREYFTAESGTGYILGIVGAVLMLALIIYPLRKRYRFMEFIGSVKTTFQTHMIMGVLGPVAILFHANFQLGSLNSNVAFFSMIIVASSGLVGRFMYKRIHYGLYGRHASLNDLHRRYENEKGEIAEVLDFSPAISKHLLAFSDKALNSQHGFLQSLGSTIIMGIKTRIEYWKIRRMMTKESRMLRAQKGWNFSYQRKIANDAHRRIWVFLSHVRNVTEFQFYERMFSLWHVFHLPLAIMLLFSSIFHVIAVHAY